MLKVISCLLWITLLMGCNLSKWKLKKQSELAAVTAKRYDSLVQRHYSSMQLDGERLERKGRLWLRGQVHIDPDSGINAQEAWINVDEWRMKHRLTIDTQVENVSKTTDVQQRVKENQRQMEQQKEASVSNISFWWVLGGILIIAILVYRLFR